jgi:lipopolysaccharide export system permease protein
LKKIDKLIATSFIGPAILSYFIATFVLIMQFLWKYIDEILGKGLSILEILELIFYHAVTLIPMAVPITVLISSVMVYGDMAEKYELSSMKSAGVSLLRLLMPGFVIACFIGLFSLVASNFLKPASFYQFNKRFLAIRKAKSSLAIEEGIFNNAFNETVIRVNKIDSDKRGINDVLIYDHTENDKSLIQVTSAKSGEMYTAKEGKYFIMELDSGVNYQEMEKKSKLGSSKSEIPFTRMYFDKWIVSFDMSVFSEEGGLLNLSRDQMMNSMQLLKSVDSFNTVIQDNNEKTANRIANLFTGEQTNTKDSTQSNPAITSANKADTIGVESRKLMLQKTLSQNKDNLSTKEKLFLQSQLSDLTNSKVPSPGAVVNKKLVKQKDSLDLNKEKYFVNTIDSADFRDVIIRSISDLSRDRDELLTSNSTNKDFISQNNKYLLRLNQQYSWAAVCILFLFIGAPLGSIIRKGGYGYPLLVAILFYMMFIISTIYGEKLVKTDSMGGIQAAWVSCMLLLPWAVILTYMALRDMGLNTSAFTDMVARWIPESLKRKFVKPETSVS